MIFICISLYSTCYTSLLMPDSIISEFFFPSFLLFPYVSRFSLSCISLHFVLDSLISFLEWKGENRNEERKEKKEEKIRNSCLSFPDTFLFLNSQLVNNPRRMRKPTFSCIRGICSLGYKPTSC